MRNSTTYRDTSPPARVVRPTIAIVAHNSYGALAGGKSGHIGGVEWQTSLMARWFAAHGYPVRLLSWDEGQPDDTEIDGVRVMKICRRTAGAPGLRFFHPRWTGLRRALCAADADVYYQNCGEHVTGQVAMWCRSHGRPFVYSVASNPDCDPRLPEMKHARDRLLYRYALKHADRVIVQTRTQQDMLQRGFDREAVVIPMPCPGPRDGEYVSPQPPAAGAGRVLWVGRIVPLKRVEWLLDIAAALPQVAFDVVGPLDGPPEYVARITGRAQMLSNVTLHGRVERERMPAFYRCASCLCCTSTHEGFPNTYLEAWSHGVPVVSTIDADDLLCLGGLGASAGDVPGLIAAITGLLGSPSQYATASSKARCYYLRHHALDVVMPKFEAVFLELAAPREARADSNQLEDARWRRGPALATDALLHRTSGESGNG